MSPDQHVASTEIFVSKDDNGSWTLVKAIK